MAATSQPGAVFSYAGQTGSPTQGFGKKLSVVGTSFDTNAFLLDGADINGVANVDVTLIKETVVPKMGENTKVQFRAEFFNVLNRANFGAPANNLYNSTGVQRSDAGVITTTNTLVRGNCNSL